MKNGPVFKPPSGYVILVSGGGKGVKDLMEKHTIIRVKQEGHSNRSVAKILGIERKTVAKYWNEFNRMSLENSF